MCLALTIVTEANAYIEPQLHKKNYSKQKRGKIKRDKIKVLVIIWASSEWSQGFKGGVISPKGLKQSCEIKYYTHSETSMLMSLYALCLHTNTAIARSYWRAYKVVICGLLFITPVDLLCKYFPLYRQTSVFITPLPVRHILCRRKCLPLNTEHKLPSNYSQFCSNLRYRRIEMNCHFDGCRIMHSFFYLRGRSLGWENVNMSLWMDWL